MALTSAPPPAMFDARRRAMRRPVDFASPIPVSHGTRCAVVAIVLAIALRLAFSIASNGALAHPDEHQQYLEQAIVQAYGYGITFWEQDRHMRHPLLVSALGQLVRILDAVGLRDPAWQAIVIRMGLSLASLTALLAWAWHWHRDGETPAAVFLIALTIVSLDVMWIQSRVLSDNAMAAPLLFALLCERRQPMICGALLAILFAVRFQAGFWIAPAVVTFAAGCWFRDRRWIPAMTPFMRLSCGFALGIVALFGGELLLFGKCSPWEYWKACITEGGASEFKVHPWYFYLTYVTRDLIRASVLLPIALWFGARREPRLAICAISFLIAHSFVGHKEVRFTWGLMPVAALLAARGFGEIWKQSPRRREWAVAIVLSFAIPSLIRVPFFSWRNGDYANSCRALDLVAHQDDVAGVVVLGAPDFCCGNHFYFRRDRPLILGPKRYPDDAVDRSTYARGPLPIDNDPKTALVMAARCSPPPNYWLVTDAFRNLLPPGRFESIGRFGDWNVLRTARTPQS